MFPNTLCISRLNLARYMKAEVSGQASRKTKVQNPAVSRGPIFGEQVVVNWPIHQPL
jgi:hypothetical protein